MSEPLPNEAVFPSSPDGDQSAYSGNLSVWPENKLKDWNLFFTHNQHFYPFRQKLSFDDALVVSYVLTGVGTASRFI